jgi:RecB family exonuclease
MPWIVAQLERLPAAVGRRAVVLLGSERQAHALRRHVCVELGRPDLLAGVLLLRPADLARETLARAGRVRLPGWEATRRLRILHLFASAALAGELRYFTPDQLRTGHGYGEAFTRTIDALEDSGLDADLARTVADALSVEDPFTAGRLHDVALTWARADHDRGTRATVAHVLGEAAAVVAAAPARIAPFGPIIAALAAAPSAVLLRFLRALPDCRVVFHDARPLRTGTQRWRAFMRGPQPMAHGQLSLFDTVGREGVRRQTTDDRQQTTDDRQQTTDDRRQTTDDRQQTTDTSRFDTARHEGVRACGLETRNDARQHDLGPPRPHASTPPDPPSELHLLQRFLFALPESLTDPRRPRSAGADGSVDLEEHPSLEEEIEATATWVSEQLLAGIAAEEIALIVPELDPYATLLADRLQRLGGTAPPLRSYVDGGLPLAASPAGQRLQMLLATLARSLEAEATIRLVPALRRADQGNEESPRAPSASRVASIVYGAGIVGGSPADASGMREWVPRLTRRRDTLRTLVESGDAAAEGADEPDKRRHTVDRQQAQRRLNEIDGLLPAMTALQHLAEGVVGGASLRDAWASVRAFAQTWIRMPPDPPNLLDTFGQQIAPVLADPVATSVRGAAALHFLIDALRRERRPTARFGEPCIFIGTPAQAAGLTFTAVRCLGLAEGALPRTPHDDPIIPDGARSRIEAAARAHAPDVVVPRLADQVLDDIHGVARVVSATRLRLALSAPRQWIDRSEREVSGIMLEVATALGRAPQGRTDEGDVPTAARLRAVYLNPGRAARQRAASEEPLSPRNQLANTVRVSPHGIAVPADWMRGGALALDRVHALTAALHGDGLTGIDGLVADAWPAVQPPGVVPERPISASALGILLSCPHRFLLERILHLGEPASRPSTDVIDPMAYGSLFHAAAERFFRVAGPSLCARDGDVDHWVARAQAIATEQFDQLRDEYPLRGADAIERERLRLLRQIEQLVRDEWRRPPREYLDSELRFGDPTPVRLPVEDGPLYVRGAIDRLDRLPPGGLSVRDLKTGRVHDLGEDPMNAGRDLQIGLYTLALEAAGGPDIAARVVEAAYVHPSAASAEDRTFAGAELDLLRRRTQGWLRVAHRLLSAGTFPRTPNPDDCRYCPFVPACGDGAPQRSAAKLQRLPDDHPLQAFVRFKDESRRDDG